MIGAVQSALYGLNAATAKADASAGKIALNAPGTDPARATVDLITAKTDYKANAAVLKTADKMQNSLLKAFDIKV